jgi:hypothetical protein
VTRSSRIAEANDARDGQPATEQRAPGDAVAFDIMRERHHGERRGGNDREDDGSCVGHQRPLITTYTECRAGHGGGQDPSPAVAPVLFGVGRGCVRDFQIAEEERGDEDAAENALIGGVDAVRHSMEVMPGCRSVGVGFPADDGAAALAKTGEDAEKSSREEPARWVGVAFLWAEGAKDAGVYVL